MAVLEMQLAGKCSRVLAGRLRNTWLGDRDPLLMGASPQSSLSTRFASTHASFSLDTACCSSHSHSSSSLQRPETLPVLSISSPTNVFVEGHTRQEAQERA